MNGGPAPGQGDYTELPLGCLELPNEGALSPPHAGETHPHTSPLLLRDLLQPPTEKGSSIRTFTISYPPFSLPCGFAPSPMLLLCVALLPLSPLSSGPAPRGVKRDKLAGDRALRGAAPLLLPHGGPQDRASWPSSPRPLHGHGERGRAGETPSPWSEARQSRGRGSEEKGGAMWLAVGQEDE